MYNWFYIRGEKIELGRNNTLREYGLDFSKVLHKPK